MKRYYLALIFALVAFLPVSHGWAASEHGTSDEAIALVKKGIAYIKANGSEKAYAVLARTQI